MNYCQFKGSSPNAPNAPNARNLVFRAFPFFHIRKVNFCLRSNLFAFIR